MIGNADGSGCSDAVAELGREVTLGGRLFLGWDWIRGGIGSILLQVLVEILEFGKSLLVIRYLLLIILHILMMLFLHLIAEGI